MIVALCGGVGGSKLVLGLYRILGSNELSVVVNTADDLELFGLHMSPDLDTVTYTLSGLAQRDVGWGIEGDTFNALEMLARYGEPAWFQVGDRDLATHIFRSQLLREGKTLTEATDAISVQMGVLARILPMTDARVRTELRVGDVWLEFQEYFVQRRHRDPVAQMRYSGADTASPTAAIVQTLQEAEALIIVNSNPLLSILPIVAVGGMRKYIRAAPCVKVAVSPIIGMSAVSGPAADLMRVAHFPPSATGVAQAYRGLIDGIVIDHADADQAGEIESLGVRVYCADTKMTNDRDKERLAAETLQFASAIR